MKTVLIVIISYLLISCSNRPDSQSLPNIVIIMTDDQGYGDVGSYGATGFETPNLDKLANEGMRFTNHYSAQPVCSASRAGLLTGCYPNRIGISGALFPFDKIGLNPEELTIAEMLKSKGYSTAIFGKWHLGHHKKFLPLQNGFDEYLGIPYSNDMWPLKYGGAPTEPGDWGHDFPYIPLVEGNETIEVIKTVAEQNKLTTLYTEKAVDFINRNSDNPFFLYVPHTMPHVPLGVSEKFKGKSKQGMYGDVIMEIDWSVGEIISALRQNNIEENTIVIFTSDNGPWLSFGNHAGSTGGLREGKLTSWEGGQRVPFIIKWPGKTPAGLICNKLTSTIDILPSLAEITGAKMSGNKIDGISITELWKGNIEAEPRKEFYYYFGDNNLNAVRKGNWKLVFPHKYSSYHTLPGNNGFRGQKISMSVDSLELYNMMRDPGENYNVIALYPEIVEELKIVADKARKELGDLNQGLERGNGTREVGKL